MNENEILGFDPSQLSVFNPDETPAKSAGNPLIYRTRPADSVSEDHVYRATIKVVYNPYNLKASILEQQSYAMQDANGYFSVVSSLTNNDTSCPIFKAWKKCRYAEEGTTLWKQQAKKEDGGENLFDKRFARYAVVQIMSDKNQPELEGKYLFWKLPKSVYDIINAKMNPSAESGKAAIPVMDFLFGRSLDIEVTPGPGKPGDERYSRETKYLAELSEDYVSCTNPDGSPLLNDSETDILETYVKAMSKVWKSKDPVERTAMLQEISADENTKALQTIYRKVLENIKSFCPDLIKELGYNEWPENVKTRVQNWIDVVLSGNKPAVGADAPADDVPTSAPTETSATETEDTNEDATDDLPF